MLRAKYSKEKRGSLEEANLEPDVLRFQVRMAMDLEALPFESHGHANKLMQK